MVSQFDRIDLQDEWCISAAAPQPYLLAATAQGLPAPQALHAALNQGPWSLQQQQGMQSHVACAYALHVMQNAATAATVATAAMVATVATVSPNAMPCLTCSRSLLLSDVHTKSPAIAMLVDKCAAATP